MLTERYPGKRQEANVVREALVAWQENHVDEIGERLYPWRLRLNPSTGLPRLVRYRLQGMLTGNNVLTDNDEENLAQIQAELFADPYATALFGEPTSEELFQREFAPEDIPIIRVNATQRHPQPMRHYIWRQIYKDIPVVGGSFGVHGAIGDDRLAIISSYLPIPEGYFADFRPIEGLEEKAKQSVIDLGVLDPAQIESLEITLVKIHGSDQVIQPFRSSYRLFRRFKLQSGYDPVWLVDVDVQNGEVLGGPWQATLHAHYYASSAEAAGVNAQGAPGTVGMMVMPTGVLNQNEWDEVKHYIKALNADGTLKDFTDDGTSEAATVAAFTLRMRNHLTSHGVPQAALQQFQVSGAVTSPAIVVKLNSDRTLTELDTMPLQVHFHADNGNGIPIPGRPERLYHPARDPEVVLHELAHAFLYLFNPAAWNIPTYTMPFVKALQEGYAFYLARSVAALDDPMTLNQPWAIAAYPPVEWAQLWDLGRASQVDGEDRLPAPNLLPQLSAANDLDCAHTVGMLWSRALWDMRKLLGELRVDELLVRAYPYLHGFIIDFELAVEAILDVDSRIVNNIHLADSSQAIWAARRIVGGQGFVEFAETSGGGNLYAAGESGVYHWNDPNWELENQTDQNTKLYGVNAIGAKDSVLCAAVALAPTIPASGNTHWQGGVFRKDTAAGNQWQQISQWPSDTVPLSVQTFNFNQDLVVGSNNRINYSLDNQWNLPNPAWQSPEAPDANDPILQLAVEIRQDGSQMIWGVSPSKVWQQAWNDDNRTSATEWIDYVATTPAQIISIAVWDGRIIVGRFDGLYEIDISDPLAISGDWKSPPVDNVTKPVLALSVGRESDPAGNPSQPVLCYATPDEVVKLFPNNLRQILPLPVATGEISVISLYAQGATLWAGTVAHGIYKWEANSWSSSLEPTLPTSLSLKQANEIGLISLRLAGAADLHFDLPANITLETVVQPGCPLAFIDPFIDPDSVKRYPCQAGTVILALRNQQNVQVMLTLARADDDVTITVV